eukprot:208185-Karenia_brevis.AAC.1
MFTAVGRSLAESYIPRSRSPRARLVPNGDCEDRSESVEYRKRANNKGKGGGKVGQKGDNIKEHGRGGGSRKGKGGKGGKGNGKGKGGKGGKGGGSKGGKDAKEKHSKENALLCKECGRRAAKDCPHEMCCNCCAVKGMPCSYHESAKFRQKRARTANPNEPMSEEKSNED